MIDPAIPFLLALALVAALAAALVAIDHRPHPRPGNPWDIAPIRMTGGRHRLADRSETYRPHWATPADLIPGALRVPPYVTFADETCELAAIR